MSEPYYVLNVNAGGMDVLHRNPRNECNTEAAKMDGRQTVDPDTADALLTMGEAVKCQHCWQED